MMQFGPGLVKLAALLALLESVAALDLTIKHNGGNKSSPLMYGLLYEDIYHSGDGGMYGELLQNRAFQGSEPNKQPTSDPTLKYWNTIGDDTLVLDNSSPALSDALPWHLRVDIQPGATGPVGFFNEGFEGMNVTTATTYTATFWLRGTYSGNVDCAFWSNTTGSALGSTRFAVRQTDSAGWKEYTKTFKPSVTAPDAKNTFRVTFDGAKTAGKSLHFNMISSFQQTFHNVPNGLRMDLANYVNDIGAKFMRFPGGNNLEGLRSPYHWKWNETIGPIINRHGFPGVWDSYQTNGLGLIEMMLWCQEMNIEPMLGLWAGLYLNAEIIPEANLQPYVDDAINELEFLTGSTSTKYGALRASFGYPKPFQIKYIEIGNEDYLNNGLNSYKSYRFNMFYNALKPLYPDVTFISTLSLQDFTPPAGVVSDYHFYQDVVGTADLFSAFDNYGSRNPVMVGEYAAIRDIGSGGDQLNDPTLRSATSEAIMFLGLERNGDRIFGAAHGAMIKSLRENPNNVAMIKHDAGDIVPSHSYYVAKLFASNYGPNTLPVTSDSNFGPLYWSATKSDSGTYFVKIVNFDGAASTPVTVKINGPSAKKATLITLTAPDASSVNLPGKMTSIWTETTVTQRKGRFSFTLPNNYVSAVLKINRH